MNNTILQELFQQVPFNVAVIDRDYNIVQANNNFKEYFRGLYFDTETMNPDGNLFLFNIENTSVTMYYRYY